MEPFDAIALASSTFVDVLDQVEPELLSAATPCEGWDIKELVGHVTMGSQMTVALLDGASQDEAMEFIGQTFSDDMVDICREAVAAQLDRILIVSDWDVIVHHPVGDVPASQLLGFRIGDLTLHSWDLAIALGIDDAIPDDLLAVVYESMLPMAAFIGDIGMFGTGPSGSVGEDAPLKTRLLDLTGRRP